MREATTGVPAGRVCLEPEHVLRAGGGVSADSIAAVMHREPRRGAGTPAVASRRTKIHGRKAYLQ